MSALVLDAGALIAVDRGDRAMARRLRVAVTRGIDLRTHPFVVAQVWRESRGSQASLARLLRAVSVVSVDDRLGRACGALLGASGTQDAIDAGVVLIARTGDQIITSDPVDLQHLVDTAGVSARVVSA